MKTSLMFVFSVVFVINTNAQSNTFANGARSSAMGNTGVAVADIWSTTNNQAALTLLENTEISAFYKNNFGMNELSLSALSAAFPTKIGVFGGSLAHFGFSEYNESKISLAYAKRLWKMFSLSAQINYNTVDFTNGYQNATAVSGEVGLFADISDKFHIGAHVFNPTQSSLSLETKEKLPTLYKVGVAYKPLATLMICSDFEYNNDNDTSFRGGIEFYLLPQFCLRAGTATNPELFTLGVGYNSKQINIDAAYAYHNVLGNISSINISYKFKKR